MSDYLPSEVYLEIIKRLPLNSILQCSTVCKSWNSLISSNDFISAHQKLIKSINADGTQTQLVRYFDRTHKIEKYILGKDDETFGLQFSDIQFQYASTTAYFRVVGYCDGVVCLSDDLFDSLYMVILWNPSIKKSVRVLVPNHEETWPQVTVLGFGVCPMTLDPKIVRIVCVSDFSLPHLVSRIQNDSSVEVFSLASGVWRKHFGGNRPHNMIQITWSQICFNGVIHWIACDKQLESNRHCLIISFDLVDEVFGEMPLPDALARHHVSELSISNRKGYLTVIDYDTEKGKESCGVWVMKEYGVMSSWEKLFTIRLPDFLRKPVGFRMNGDLVVAMKNQELVSVDSNGNIKSLNLYGNIRSYFLGPFMESLILVDKKDGQLFRVNGDGDNGDNSAFMEGPGSSFYF